MHKRTCINCKEDLLPGASTFLHLGDGDYICWECLNDINVKPASWDMVDPIFTIGYNIDPKVKFTNTGTPEEKPEEVFTIPTPAELRTALDAVVVGQEYAKNLAIVAAINHEKMLANNYDRLTKDPKLPSIKKSNIMLLGPSGCGKTLLLTTLADTIGRPHVVVDITHYTTSGYVGKTVTEILEDLVDAADGDINAAEGGWIIIDEIDKAAAKSDGRGRDVNGADLQRELLKLVEGADISLGKTGTINTKEILFCFAGAFDGLDKLIQRRVSKKSIGFHGEVDSAELLNIFNRVEVPDLIEYGLIPELLGRIPWLVPLKALTQEDMYKILVEPEGNLIAQYIQLAAMDDVTLDFTKTALKAIVDEAFRYKTGARGLESILIQVLYRTLLRLQELKGEKVTIGAKDVTQRLGYNSEVR